MIIGIGKGLRAVRGGAHETGTHHRDRHAAAAKTSAQRLAICADRRLAGAVDGRARHPAKGGERAHQRDLPAPARQHGRKRRLDRIERALDVHGEHPAALPGIRLALAAAADPGVGDHEVERGEPFDRRDPFGHALPVGDVDQPWQGLGARESAVAGDRLEPAGVAPAEREQHARARQGAGERGADAAARAGDQDRARNRRLVVPAHGAN
jgi:hypothetical protein